MTRHALGAIAIALVLSFSSPTMAETLEKVIIQDDNRFSQQEFSQTLFWHIPHGVRACYFYGMRDLCSFERSHYFSDAVLITEKESTAFVSATLVPDQPVPQEQALAYAQILNTMKGSGVEFTDPQVNADSISYFGCPWVGGNLCYAGLTLTADGDVAEIVVTYTSP